MHTRKKENRIKGRGEAAKGLVSKTTDLKAKKKKKRIWSFVISSKKNICWRIADFYAL